MAGTKVHLRGLPRCARKRGEMAPFPKELALLGAGFLCNCSVTTSEGFGLSSEITFFFSFGFGFMRFSRLVFPF